MASWLDITARDLEHWAGRHDARADLPKLVRQLVRACIGPLDQVDFPAGEQIQRHGYDGVVTAEAGSEFVPQGVSVWEVSTESSPSAKAKRDYAARSRASGPDITPRSTTFVLVTPRSWPGGQKWARERTAEGIWRDVRVIDGSRLEQWLERCPGPATGLSGIMGKRPHGVHTLEEVWQDWSRSTTPPCDGDLVLAGREECVSRLRAWASSDQSNLVVRAETEGEAIAVVAASWLSDPAGAGASAMARALVVDTPNAMATLCSQDEQLILLPTFHPDALLVRARDKRHRVAWPQDGTAKQPPDALEIPRFRAGILAGALRAKGVPREQAAELAQLGCRSTQALRRRLDNLGAVGMPPWAGAQAERRIIAVCSLLGTWEIMHEPDLRLVEELCECPTREVQAALLRWGTDPPFRLVHDTMSMVSREDAWVFLAEAITARDLSRFDSLATKVLRERDPRLDCAAGERWCAAANTTSERPSALLRKGIAETLAFLGSRGSTYRCGGGADPTATVDRVVGKVAKSATSDWNLWASLADVLTALMEASPDVLLSALGESLEDTANGLGNLFSDPDHILLGTSPHCSLLWALEVAAWAPEYLPKASLLLARLDEIDPGGQLANRPANSLRHIFLPWLPQTAASLDARLAVVDGLRHATPRSAWKLLLAMLPEHHAAGMDNPKPRWREWADGDVGRVGTSQMEFRACTTEVLRRVLEDAGRDDARWKEVVEAIPTLHAEGRRASMSALHALDPGRLGQGVRTELWAALRDVVAHHRQFPEAAWVLPEEDVQQLEVLRDRFVPVERSDQVAWLFDDWPDLPTPEREYERRVVEIQKAQDNAARQLLEGGGMELVLRLAAKVKDPFSLGLAVGRCAPQSDVERVVPELLCASERPLVALARGVCHGRGEEWILETLTTRSAAWTVQQKATLCLCLALSPETWQRVEGFGPDGAWEYWRSVNGLAAARDQQHVRFVCGKLLAAGRPAEVVEILGPDVGRGTLQEVDLGLAALEALLKAPMEPGQRLQGFEYWISELLSGLAASEDVDQTRLATLEWAFLEVLDHHRKPAMALSAMLAESPAFFVEVLSAAFKAHHEDRDHDLTQDELTKARLAYRLLHVWRTLPGTLDGVPQFQPLLDWVKEAQALAAEVDRADIGDQCIGAMLSGAPDGTDSLWPHEVVRDVLERVASSEVDLGLEVAIYNSRGVTSRDPADGGAQEYVLAQRYRERASALRDRWPRTAGVMERLAGTYQKEGEREDRRRDLRDEHGLL